MNSPVRILYVDDYPLDRELVRDALEKENDGFELVEAASRADFETALAQGGFDLILSDFNILGFEGLQVIETVRATGSNQPVIIVTGTGSEEVAAEAIKRGAADYVIKTPKHIQRLPHIIRFVLEKKRLEDERQQAEAALRISDARYQLIAEHVGDIVWQLDIGLRFIYLSPAITHVLGYAMDEALGVHVTNFLSEEGMLRMKEVIQARLKNPDQPNSPTEYKMKHKAGHWVDVEVVSSPVYDKDGHPIGFAGITRNITERKLAEERLLQSHELLANLARLVPGVIYQYRLYPDGHSAFPYSSPGINDIYEVTPEDVQEDASPIFGRLHPDDYDHVANTIQESARTLNEFYCEFRVILPRQGLRWRWSQAHPERTTDGGTLWHGIISDITESRQAQEKIQQLNAELEKRVEERTRELRDTQEQLVQQERLAVLGRLASSLAHELRNPLGIINNAIYYLRIIQNQADANVQEYLGIIDVETRNADKIISALLDFSSNKLTDVEPVAVSNLVNQVLERFPAPEGISVKLEIAKNLPNAYIDPRHITQVLGNLLVNAYQAMPNGGELRVSSEQRMENREQRAESGEQPVGTEPLLSTPLLSNNWILITIRDSGVGITPENIQKLFEPLFTTKAKGLGLGLAVSKKLIEANGGKIAAESEPSKGSKFTVYLPVTN